MRLQAAELDSSIGVYSDFAKITSQSIRPMGKGLAVIGIPDTNLTMKVGVWYINREKYKLLPAGGFVWKPSPLTEFDILFPNPKFTQLLDHHARRRRMVVVSFRRLRRRGVDHQAGRQPRLRRRPTRSTWWTTTTSARPWASTSSRPRGATGFFEGGYAFERQLNYASGLPSQFVPDGAFYVHAGISF